VPGGQGIPVRHYRNLKEEPLPEGEVRALAAKVGGVEKLLSRRAMKYPQMGLHEYSGVRNVE
jgi:arsenate reductase-like glutaredoxin family protein